MSNNSTLRSPLSPSMRASPCSKNTISCKQCTPHACSQESKAAFLLLVDLISDLSCLQMAVGDCRSEEPISQNFHKTFQCSKQEFSGFETRETQARTKNLV